MYSDNKDRGIPVPHQLSWTMQAVLMAIRTRYPGVLQVTTERLQSWLDGTVASPVILDCRPKEEYVVSHLPDARPVSPDAEATDVKQTLHWIKETKPQGDVKVVCYCALGYRASKYAKAIEQLAKQESGDKRLTFYNLEGSLFKWANENRDMVDGQGQKTIYVHPYGAAFAPMLRSDIRKYKL